MLKCRLFHDIYLQSVEYPCNSITFGCLQIDKGEVTSLRYLSLPESLFSLLYLDTDKLDLLVKRINRAIREFLPSKNERYSHEAVAGLEELARVHVYFELTRLEWRWR